MKATMLLISILTLSGCFSSPSNGGGKSNVTLKILWEYAYDLDGGAPHALPLIHGDRIVTSGDIKVTSLDFVTGEMVWKTPFEHHRQLLNQSFGLNNDVLTGGIAKSMLAWNVQSGTPIWQLYFPDSLSFNNTRGIHSVPNGFVAVSDGPRLYKIDLHGNMEIIKLDARSYESTYVEGVLYVGQVMDSKGVVSAYNLETMELIWRFAPGNYGYPVFLPPIVNNGIVYIGTAGGPTDSQNGFFALNAVTGQEIWRKEGLLTYSAVLDGDYLYVNDAGGVHKLRKANGTTVWHTDFGSSGTAPIAYGYGHIYAPHSGAMRILDAETGEIVHTMSPPSGSFFWKVIADKGRIFAQSNRHLYAFAPWGHEEAIE